MVRLDLLDADVVIWLFENGIWDKLIKTTRIILVKSVFNEALYYYEPDTQAKICINLQPYVDRRLIDVVDVDADSPTVKSILERCQSYAWLHNGELESIAHLIQTGPDTYFCTADNAAIRALAFLGLSDRGLSLECLLVRVGLKQRVPARFSESRFKHWLKQGSITKIQHFKPE